MVALLTPDNRTKPDMSEVVHHPASPEKPDGQDKHPIGVSSLSGLGAPLAGQTQARSPLRAETIRRPPDLSAWGEPERKAESAKKAAERSYPAWSIIPDRWGQDGPETTVLGACVAFGLPFREVRRAFMAGRPPRTPRVGRIDEWGVLWASRADLSALFCPTPDAKAEPLAANKASLRVRLERLRRELANVAA